MGIARAVLRNVAWPGTFAAAVGAVHAGIAAHPGSRAFETALVTAVLWVVVLWVWALQRWLPLRDDWRSFRGEVGVDLLHATISAVAGATIARMVFFSGVEALSSGWGFGVWPDGWHPLAQLALAVPISDLGVFCFHAASHRFGWLWRLHEAHHSSTVLHGLSASRAHPLYVALSTAASSCPLLALGMDPPVFALLSTVLGVSGLFQHANLDLAYGPAAWLVATPDVHRWHHADDPVLQRRNYGNVLSVWDRLAGTFVHPSGTPARLGLGYPFPRSFLAHLTRPFTG